MTSVIKKFVVDGGTLLIHNIPPSNIKPVSEICGKQVKLSPINATAWQGRALTLNYASALAGLTNLQLFLAESTGNWKLSPHIFFIEHHSGAIGEMADWLSRLWTTTLSSIILESICGQGDGYTRQYQLGNHRRKRFGSCFEDRQHSTYKFGCWGEWL